MDHEPHAEPSSDLGEAALRTFALRDLLIERGVVTRAELDRAIQISESKTPAKGAAVVARAWTDHGFRDRLLDDAAAALAEMGIDWAGESSATLVAIANSDDVRHVVVCTLCSCYPRPLLGRPPDWYKSNAYRARVVRDPRSVLQEFGTDVGDVEIRVHDSTADIRYLVVPQRPAGTERMDEAELARLVSRDSMIGVSDPMPTDRG